MLPVDFPTLGTFVIAAGALVVSPGPDTLLIVRYTLTSGRQVGFATVAGVQLGLMVHTLLAVLGISLIIASSPPLFKAVAVAGAAYLAWLGIQGLRGGGKLGMNGETPPVGMARACRDAILCNVLNPKVILLFLALFPNFVDTRRDDVTAQLVTLAVTLIIVNVVWQAPIAWAADAIRRWLLQPRVIKGIDRITGAILLILAALLLFENLL